MEAFQTFVNLIGYEYRRLGLSLGSRFFCVSREVLERDPKVVLVTLNPGGNAIPADHPSESCEEGSAYSVEQWGGSARGRHPLQVQVQALFEHVAARVDAVSRKNVSIATSLIGYFIPFRSPRPTGWGDISADVKEFRFDEFSTCVLRLPHLSTFKLFSRLECVSPMAAILDDACRFL